MAVVLGDAQNRVVENVMSRVRRHRHLQLVFLPMRHRHAAALVEVYVRRAITAVENHVAAQHVRELVKPHARMRVQNHVVLHVE